MRPCDCHDEYTTRKFLKEQGIAFGNVSLEIHPPNVVIEIGGCSFKLLQNHFMKMINWYLEYQEEDL